ncbi:unknown [Dialister sp. CAG:357]|nr:unknown [Dialister sp. CAG:357]
MIFLRHDLRHPHKRQKLIQNLIRVQIRIPVPYLVKPGIKRREVHRLHIQNRSVFLRIMQIRNERIQRRLQFFAPICKKVDHVRIKSVALHDGIDLRLDSTGKEPAVILAGFHHHSKISKLRRAVVDVEAVEIILHNAGSRVSGCISIRLINLHQHVEHVANYVTAAHAGIDSADLIRRERRIFFFDLVKLLLNFRFLLCFFQIIFPAFFQVIIRMTFYPQTPERVLDHIADNPIRCEQLCSRWDFLFCDLLILLEVSKDLVLRLSVVILIQPADNLHLILPVFLRNLCYHLFNHAAISEQIIWKQKLRVVRNLLEHAQQNTRERIALRDDKVLEQCVVIISIL